MVWLTVASIMPPNYQNESFYYDAQHKEFFILTMFDYLLIGDNDGFEFQYTEEEANRLIDKISRIDNHDSSLIEIPRLNLEQRKDLQMRFVDTLNSHDLQLKLFDVVNSQTAKQQLALDEILNSELHDTQLVDEWGTFKSYWMQELAEDFENDHLPLSEVSVWKIECSRAVKKLAATREEPARKPFWKFW